MLADISAKGLVLDGKSESASNRFQHVRKRNFLLRLVGCFLSVFLATAFIRIAPSANYLIWFSNGVLLAYFLLAPRRRWLAYGAVGFVAQVVASIMFGHNWRIDVLCDTLNLFEVSLAAVLLRKRNSDLPHFTDRAYLLRFVTFAVLASPSAAGVLFSIYSTFSAHTAFGPMVVKWTVADGLGIGVASPACIAIFRAQPARSLGSWQIWLHLVPVAAISYAIFAQNQAPLPFLLYPILVGIQLRFGLEWAALDSLVVAGIGSLCTFRGLGPFAASSSLTPLGKSVVLQLYVACALFLLYSISVVVDGLRRTQKKLEEAYRSMEKMAITDPLTQLANRRYFDQCLAAEWRRAMRDRQPLSLLLLDVDLFKLYNDTYGHLRGDRCLRQIAEACRGVISRPGDLVARFGGEEFAIILPGTDNGGAMVVADLVCSAIRNREIKHVRNRAGVITVSVGCATRKPRFDEDSDGMIELADQALYRAKRAGRDQVCNSDQGEQEPAFTLDETATIG
jgi:diguanylate cyclase (GGDEF)-like protein